jgi:endonuclease/exonuclease/phosphatase family metal-dependent hydrolase
MPLIDPPADVSRDLAALSAALDSAVPAALEGNLLIGTWNLRGFGALTPTWRSGPGDSPKRDWHAIACIAAVVSRFDVVAVQETRRTTTALRALLDQLGAGWQVICSDVTEGPDGNGERLAYLYNSARVAPSGLVGEIVLPAQTTGPVSQFARTPYLASFTRAGTEFILATVHLIWGNKAADRLPEVTAFATWMRQWAERRDDWNGNLLVLGDFNLDRIGDPLFEAFLATGLWPPAELNTVPRTIFQNDSNTHLYDQIAWFTTPEGNSLLNSLTYTGHAGGFDFLPHTHPGMTRTEVSWRISDHYPLWAEFRTDPPKRRN